MYALNFQNVNPTSQIQSVQFPDIFYQVLP